MKIVIAETAGFCFGVKRAVNLAFNTQAKDQTHTLGPIIHNDTVIKRLGDQGVTAINAEDLDEKQVNTLIIRAHGVGKAVYTKAKERGIQLVDATCPYVKKIHKIVKDYSEKNYSIIIIGDAGHPEIQGIEGWVNGACYIIKSVEAIDYTLLDKNQDYIVVAQTTYKRSVVDKVLEALKQEGYKVEYISTICNATTERQEEAALISSQVEAMIVIGSAHSSNTQKLYEICLGNCKDTWCINELEDLDLARIKDKKSIGITAGASTPDDLIEQVVDALEQLK